MRFNRKRNRSNDHFIGVCAYLAFVPNQQRLSPPQTLHASKPITISGEITCLPKKGPGPHTLECAIGIKGNDDKHYGLKNLFRQSRGEFSRIGMRVEVSGTLNPEEMREPCGVPYDITGIIEIASIREI